MSSDNLALSIRGLSKTYRIASAAGAGQSSPARFRARARHPFARPPKEDVHALRDVSLDVDRGEAVGIIGRNGAGKSTLLKIVSRIVEPTTGRIELYGRVGSLLEVGTGFHLELTGRENVFLNGAILGMTKRDIVQQFDSIVEFAQVERFLETPVKRFSSGMYVRLAFAVAAHLNPEILIVDEVLAVGDAQYQKKCLGKMDEVARTEGRTVLFVSHNLTAVASFCPRSVYIEAGSVLFDGKTADAVERYMAGGSGGERQQPGIFDLSQVERRPGMDPVLRRVELRRVDGTPAGTVPMGDGLRLEIDVEGLELPRQGLVARIATDTDVGVLNVAMNMTPLEVYDAGPTPDRVVLRIPSLPLVPGRYWIDLFVQEGHNQLKKTIVDHVERAAELEVVSVDVYGNGYELSGKGRWAGIIFTDPLWEVHSGGAVIALSRRSSASVN